MAEWRDEGGIEVGPVVDLASGPRSRLGKERWKKKKKQPGSPARGSAQLPQAVELQSTKKRKKEKRRNMYFIVFLKQALGNVVACLKKQH